MSPPLTHQEIEGLLGAFAVDAVDGDEAETIELHLRSCPRCRAEVTEHREVAALLAHSGAAAPEGVWDKILEEIEPAPPVLRMPETPPGAGVPVSAIVRDLSARRSSVPMRTMLAVVAAAAVIVSVLGVVAVDQTRRLGRMDAALREVSVDRMAERAMIDPQATTASLRSKDGSIKAPVVVNANGLGYLLAAKLPALPRGRTYQLWGAVRGSVLSLGAFDGGTNVVQFQVGNWRDEHLTQLMVTDEKAPGVLASKHRPLVSGAV